MRSRLRTAYRLLIAVVLVIGGVSAAVIGHCLENAWIVAAGFAAALSGAATYASIRLAWRLRRR